MPEKSSERAVRVTVNSRHVNEPASVRAYAAEKFARLEKFSLHLRSVSVMLQPEGAQWECEAVMLQDRQPRIVVSVLAGDLNSAVDMAVERSERQLVRGKERISERFHRRPADRPERADADADADADQEGDEED